MQRDAYYKKKRIVSSFVGWKNATANNAIVSLLVTEMTFLVILLSVLLNYRSLCRAATDGHYLQYQGG